MDNNLLSDLSVPNIFSQLVIIILNYLPDCKTSSRSSARVNSIDSAANYISSLLYKEFKIFM